MGSLDCRVAWLALRWRSGHGDDVIADWITLEVAAVLLFATLIRSAFGFGEALVAVPLLAFLIPIEVAAPLAALASITVAAVILLQDWSHVHVRSAGRLVIATCLGIPLGLLLLLYVAEPVVKAILAVIITTFSLYSLMSRRRMRLATDRTAWLFGFSAGVLGGAYGMNGPPLVIYGALRGWSPQHFRATLQGYFLPASLMGVVGYWFAGLWTAPVSRYYLASLPGMLIAILAGRLINRRMHGPRFLVYIHIGLVVIGVMLLMQAMRGG